MDSGSLLQILAVLCVILKCLPGQEVRPVKVEVTIWEEKVIVTWQPPEDAPENAKYFVQLTRPNAPRVNVTSCASTDLLKCDISELVSNYSSRYFVWVRMLTVDQGNVTWKGKKWFTMTESLLLPPVFSLAAGSGSVRVKIQQKPILLDIFKYGITFTVSLTGEDKNQTIQETTFDYDPPQFKEEITFEDLSWGQTYCVDVKAESRSKTSHSFTSHCIYLSPDKFTVVTLVVISVFVSVVVLVILGGVLYVLCHPAKMPATLKPSGTKWQPLRIDQTPVEVVITNGWFLSRPSPDDKRKLSEDKMAILQEEEKRGSLDSGVSMVASSTDGDAETEGPQGLQEDSGCGSLGSSAENEIEHGGSTMLPLEEGRTMCNGLAQREDSGLGLGFNSESAGGSEGEDTGSLPDAEVTSGDGYRSKSPSSLPDFNSRLEATLTQTQPEADFDMAAPVVGYRPSQVIGHIAPTVHVSDIMPIMDTNEQDLPVPNYLRKTQTVEPTGLLDSLTFSCESSQSLDETTPFIVSLPHFLLSDKGADCGLSLNDIELNFG
ncbi:interleukin-10 receptor subunit alpha [Sardina pilchardus]|uniref:interleukin-10 receptor subunit alpha n=1 Tax=Sardina pilchardus TaxID=27697 RepID=UPI002E131918